MVCGDDSYEDHELFRTHEEPGSMSWSDSSCSNSHTESDWEFVLESTAENGYTAHNRVENEKRFYLYSMWTDLPESLLGPCNRDYYRPEPVDVEFIIRHPDGYTPDHFDFIDVSAQPDSDEGDGSKEQIYDSLLTFAATVAGSASGSVLVAASAAAIAEYIDISASDPVDIDQGTYSDTQREQWWWFIDINGESPDDFPQEACNAAAVSFKISNNLNYDEEGKIHSWVKWRFRYWSPGAEGCPCDMNLPFERDTSYAFNDLIWKSVR